MTDAQPRRPARETPVRDEKDILAESGALHRGGYLKHLPHPGTPYGALGPDHHDVAVGDLMAEQSIERRLLTRKDTGRSLEGVQGHTGNLDHGAIDGEVPSENGDPALCGQRLCRIHDHVLIIGHHDVDKVLCHRLAGDCQHIAIEETLVEQRLEDHRDTPNPVEIDHVIAPEGLQIPQVRCPPGNAIKVFEIERHIGLVGNRQKVKHGVGRSAEGHHRGDGILEGGTGHDLPRGHPRLEQRHDRLPGATGKITESGIDGGHSGRARQRHADRLADRRHRVGGEHART